MNDEGFQRIEIELKLNVFRRALEQLPVSLPFDGPVAVPYALLRKAGARDPRTGAVEPPVIVKSLAINIRKSEVREVKIVNPPRGTIGRCSTALALAEEHQLESE